MSRTRACALLAAALVAACAGGKDEPAPAKPRPAHPTGVVIGAGSPAAAGGHRVVGGVVGGASEAQSAQFQVKGAVQP